MARILGYAPFSYVRRSTGDKFDEPLWDALMLAMWVAWRDRGRAASALAAHAIWHRHLFRNPKVHDQVVSYKDLPNALRLHLQSGRLTMSGSRRSDGHAIEPISKHEWFDNYFDGQDYFFTSSRTGSGRTFENLVVERDEVLKLWPSNDEQSAISASVSTVEPAPKTKVGGRVMADHWHDMWAEVCRIVHEEGVPADRLTLVKRMEQWFTDHDLEAPAPQKLNPVLDRLFKTLGR